MSPRSNRKTSTWSAINFKKNTWPRWAVNLSLWHAWSCDTGQRIPCFDRCQLIITWYQRSTHSKPRLHVSLSTCYLEYDRHVARLRRRRTYAPTSNTASHDNHEKIDSWVSFCFPNMGCWWGFAIKKFNSIPLQTVNVTFFKFDRKSVLLGSFSL